MTLKQFQELPALITRDKMKEVTGLSDEDIRALVAAKKLAVFHRPGFKVGKNKARQARGPYGRYYTVEVARLCGFDLNKG